jgi:glutamate racemase
MKVGFFDSGIGGLTVLNEALRVLPNSDYIYFADTANVPYGVKPKDEIKKHILNAASFITNFGISALVVACNTATSIAIGDLRKTYDIPIIGMEPAVKPAVIKNENSGKRVLVFATPLTLKESKFQQLVSLIDQNNIVDFLALPELVTFAESLEFDDKIIIPYLKEKLKNFKTDQYGTVVLGCTHFPFFRSNIKKVFASGIDIIDGSKGTIKRLSSVLGNIDQTPSGCGNISFYSSGNTESDESRFQKALKIYSDSMY